MSVKITMREVLARFRNLKREAKRYAQRNDDLDGEIDLHDAAIAYAVAVRKVGRPGRT